MQFVFSYALILPTLIPLFDQALHVNISDPDLILNPIPQLFLNNLQSTISPVNRILGISLVIILNSLLNSLFSSTIV